MYEIIAVRTKASEDQSHRHIDLVGYASPHIEGGEAITIPPARVIQRIALGEKFFVMVNGDEVEVSAGACDLCGLEPYLKSGAGSPGDLQLLSLPEK